MGGRYGSIEPKSGLSYTEVEFDYARSLGKPFFSIVVTEQGLEDRVKQHGTKVLERSNEDKHRAFREKVTSQLCAFFTNSKDVKLAVFETIPQFTEAVHTGGWVSAVDVTPSEDVARQLTALLEENRLLRTELEKAQAQLQRASGESGSLDQLRAVLDRELVAVPENVAGITGDDGKPLKVSVLWLAILFSNDLAVGVANNMGTSETESFLFHNVASRLASYGLVEEAKVPGTVHWQRLKLSKEGVKFLTRARLFQEAAQPQAESSAVPREPTAVSTEIEKGSDMAKKATAKRRTASKKSSG